MRRRLDAHAAVAHGVAGRLGQRLDAHEPLQRQPRLDDRVAARAVPDGVHVRALLGHDPAVLAQRRDHRARGPRSGPGPANGPGAVITRALVHDRRCIGRSWRRPISKSFGSCAGRDLDRAGAERRVDVLVGDDRDARGWSAAARPSRADQVPVALVVGVHGHGGVAEHRLGPGGGHHDRVVAVAVADRDQLARLVGVVDLDVATAR